jgi:hypothetical protein
LKVFVYGLPIVAVLAVALALLTAGSARPYRIARLWGGPTDGARLSFRVEVLDVREDRGGGFEERPVDHGTVRARVARGGFEAVRFVPLDVEGGGELRLDAPAGGPLVEVEIDQGERSLARGSVELSAERWAEAARRRGGLTGGAIGTLGVRVAPRRGALAVPFEEDLVVEVARDGAPVGGAEVVLSATGARVSPARVRTGGRGRVIFRIQPEEHTVRVHVGVDDHGSRSDGSFGLGVVPGALRATLEGRNVLVESPVPREVAYLALVTERERLIGARLTLKPDRGGTSSARFELPAGLEPTHAVVASDRDLRSSSAVGWTLAPRADGTPERTFDAVDALLLDGRPRAAHRERLRRDRVRYTTAALCALLLLIEMLLLISITRSSDRRLEGHLSGAGVGDAEAERVAPRRSSALFVALLLVALGFLVVTLTAVLKLE